MRIKGKEVILADLHLHSKYARASSKDLSFEKLAKYAKIKGVDLLGTGDFTHPKHFDEIRKLKEKNGVYYYKDFPFIITGEVSLIYTQGKGRKIHLILLAPNLGVAEKINNYLDSLGRRDYDGRPIFSISCIEFVKNISKISEDIEIIPAHCWTPYFGVFGSKSGFDSLKDAFGEQIERIHAIETGLSSDPPMNWRVRELDNFSILSFSDSHSYWPWRIGREATIFNFSKKELSYKKILESIRKNDIFGTIEVDPAYGMYHWDGHRNCGFSCSPEKTREIYGLCPVCGDPLTIGVDFRVGQIADSERKIGFKTKNAKLFFKILPLHEIISLYSGKGLSAKENWEIYNGLIEKFGNELNVLISVEKNDLIQAGINEKLAELILKNRDGKIKVKPGYDGQYGEAVLEEQKKLF